MKYTILLFSFVLISSCTTSKYHLDDANQDSKFLVEKINEFSKKGLTSKRPILVIDGVEYVDVDKIDLKGMGISKDDIKSIELLKKDAAVSVFGSAGERGVLLITTKNSKEEG